LRNDNVGILTILSRENEIFTDKYGKIDDVIKGKGIKGVLNGHRSEVFTTDNGLRVIDDCCF